MLLAQINLQLLIQRLILGHNISKYILWTRIIITRFRYIFTRGSCTFSINLSYAKNPGDDAVENKNKNRNEGESDKYVESNMISGVANIAVCNKDKKDSNPNEDYRLQILINVVDCNHN